MALLKICIICMIHSTSNIEILISKNTQSSRQFQGNLNRNRAAAAFALQSKILSVDCKCFRFSCMN